MKKKSFNIIDILIILVLIACVAGIIARAVRMAGVKTEEYYDYRVSFTAQLDEKQLEEINVDLVLHDEKGTEYRLLEGYWITPGEETKTINGEFLITGRLTESGFESDGGHYFKNDVITLDGSDLSFEATLGDFVKQ